MTPLTSRFLRVSVITLLLCLRGHAVLAAGSAAGIPVPFSTGFESDEGFQPGPLPTLPGWSLTDDLSAEILAADAPDGPVLSLAGDGWLILDADHSDPQAVQDGVLWLDLWVKPVFSEFTADPEPGMEIDGAVKFAFSAEAGQGRVLVLDGVGEGQWIPLSQTFPLEPATGRSEDWIRLSVRLDYTRQSWDVYVNEALSCIHLGFSGQAAAAFHFFALRGSPAASVRVDVLQIDPENPLFEDSSGDGLPDDWLLAYGLDIHINQRDLDPDNDGLTNLQEFLLGTNPVNPDTDGDGLSDGMEVLLGLNPLQADSFVLGSVPFTDGFESDTPGPFAHGTRLWSLDSGEAEIVSAPDAPEGLQFLEFVSHPSALSRFFNVTQTLQYSSVHVDMRMKVAYREHGGLEALEPYNRAAVFYVGPDGRVRAFSGNAGPGGQWFALDHAPLPDRQWARFTVRLNYPAQTWSLWVNNVRYAENFGFRDPVPAFSLVQFDELKALDGFAVTPEEPDGLDNDGDGLTNAEELALGTDPDNPDTSGDGMTDGDKVRLGLDPLQTADFFATLEPDGQGGYHWHTAFTAAEGYLPGGLDGQNDWFAEGADVTVDETVGFSDSDSAAVFHRFAATHPVDRIWLRFRARLQPGRLPNPPFAPGEPVTVAFGYTAPHALRVWNSDTQSWYARTLEEDGRDWNDYALYLDYQNRRAMLLVNGNVVAADIPHATDLISTFSRFRILREALAQADPAAENHFEIDHITLSTLEPPEYDFSGDGMTNAEKRALGLDPWLNDNSGDGFSDVWLIAHGLDPLTKHDPNLDLDGDGLTLAQEYALGLSPNHNDDRHPGLVMFERWNNLGGGKISDLIQNSAFSQPPNQRQLLTGLVSTQRQGDLYGARIRGYIVPSETGYHQFFLASDDQGELWLSPTDSPFDRKRIARAPQYTGINQFDKFSEQTSEPIYLQAGSYYYVEILQKEAAGNDFVRVAWTRPGIPAIETVGAEHIAYFAPREDDPAGDGLPAAWKIAHGLNPNLRHGIHGAYGDFDGDGLSNLEEYQLGTHPGLWDTSGDGISDSEAMWVYGLSPLDQITRSQTQHINGDAATVNQGEWKQADGGLYAEEGRGSLDLALEIPEAGLYELIVNTHARSGASLVSGYDYAVYIGGEFVRRVQVPAGGAPFDGKVLTPWLDPGFHSLELVMENTLTGRQIQVNSFALSRVEGPFIDEHGVDIWAKNILESRNGVETVIFHSHTSPFNLEGRARYLTMLTVNEGTLVAQPAPDDRFHLDVPLNAVETTPLTLRFENGGLEDSATLQWTPYSLAVENDPMILRKGETLQLVWEENDPVSGMVEYRLDDVLIATQPADEQLFIEMDTAGVYEFTASIPGSIRSMQLDVREADLGEDFYVLATDDRTWTPPDVSAAHDMEGDHRLKFLQISESPIQYGVRSSVPEPRHIAVRTHGAGPDEGRILDTVAVRGLRVASNSEVHAKEEYVYADGTRLVSVGIVLNEVPEDLQVEVKIFVGGVTFTDGSLVKILTAADFDEYGRAQFQFLKSPEVDNSVCHRLFISIGDTYLGSN